jgi:hypothetical protein
MFRQSFNLANVFFGVQVIYHRTVRLNVSKIMVENLDFALLGLEFLPSPLSLSVGRPPRQLHQAPSDARSFKEANLPIRPLLLLAS